MPFKIEVHRLSAEGVSRTAFVVSFLAGLAGGTMAVILDPSDSHFQVVDVQDVEIVSEKR